MNKLMEMETKSLHTFKKKWVFFPYFFHLFLLLEIIFKVSQVLFGYGHKRNKNPPPCGKSLTVSHIISGSSY